jgi:hypothetical protein
MAGIENYPRYPLDHPRTLERPLHDRYSSSNVLRLQQIGPNAQMSSKSYDETSVDDDGEFKYRGCNLSLNHYCLLEQSKTRSRLYIILSLS